MSFWYGRMAKRVHTKSHPGRDINLYHGSRDKGPSSPRF